MDKTQRMVAFANKAIVHSNDAAGFAAHFVEFTADIEAALALARSMDVTTVLVVGMSGTGKTVLSQKYAEQHEDVRYVDHNWTDLALRPPECRLDKLDMTLRQHTCILDEPQWYSNLAEFLSQDGAPVIVLVQNLEHAKQMGLDPDMCPKVYMLGAGSRKFVSPKFLYVELYEALTVMAVVGIGIAVGGWGAFVASVVDAGIFVWVLRKQKQASGSRTLC